MKKRTKTAVILAFVFIIAGLCMGVGGMSALGWDWQKLDTSALEEKFYEQTDADVIEAINISVVNFPIKIVKGDKVSLKYFADKNNDIKIALNGKTLEIIENNKWIYSFKFFNFKDRGYTLTVPDNLDLRINTINCEINADNLVVKNLIIDSTKLDMNVSNLTAKNIKISSVNADVILETCVSPIFKIDCANTRLVSKSLTADVINLKFANFNDATDTLAIKGVQSDYYVKVDLVNGNPIANQTGNNTGKQLIIDGVNFDGKLEFII